MSWTTTFIAPGDETTIDHYTIFYSTDCATGQNITALTDVAVNGTGSYSFTLPNTLPSTTVIYVKAVGKPMLQNHMTAGQLCTVCGSGTITTVRPTVANATPNQIAYSNPTNAEDGNLATFAGGTNTMNLGSGEIWSAFGSVTGTPTLINLKISSAANCGTVNDGIELDYSLDGGNTWTLVYSMGLFGGSCINRPQQTDVISLPLNQALSQVQVRGLFTSFGSSSHQVFDSWIEVTH